MATRPFWLRRVGAAVLAVASHDSCAIVGRALCFDNFLLHLCVATVAATTFFNECEVLMIVPDCGDKLKQKHELDEKLTVINSSPGVQVCT